MTLPPWLWRVLRSRKTRRAGIVGFCLLMAAVAGFYLLANWWGRREFAKAEAEVRARGFPVPERVVRVADLPESFFCQPGYLAEAERSMSGSLGGHLDFAPGRANETLDRLGWDELSPEQIAADRAWLAPLESRRAALIQAARQATPLASLAADARIELPERDYLLTLRLARFLRDDAVLAKAAGDSGTAIESMEAYFRIMRGDLLPPRVIQQRKKEVPWEISEMIEKAILRAGCRGYSDDQLAKLDGMLIDAAFQAVSLDYFRGMPGHGIQIHREIVTGKMSQPRPYAGGLFSTWSWDRAEVRRRANVAWEAWKPFGLQEAEMARSLRKVADFAENPGTAAFEELMKSAKAASYASRLVEHGYPAEFVMHWRPEARVRGVLARHLVALERQRLRHGALPSRLEDLDADLRERLPVDAFTGKPLDYATDGKGGFKLGFTSPDHPRGRREIPVR